MLRTVACGAVFISGMRATAADMSSSMAQFLIEMSTVTPREWPRRARMVFSFASPEMKPLQGQGWR